MLEAYELPDMLYLPEIWLDVPLRCHYPSSFQSVDNDNDTIILGETKYLVTH